jgi:hypothetical protein
VQRAARFLAVRDAGYLILQYWLFYAMNDWRSTFGGVNDHEAGSRSGFFSTSRTNASRNWLGGVLGSRRSWR